MSTKAERIDHNNDQGFAHRRGATRIDVEVIPEPGEEIRDVHLWVGHTESTADPSIEKVRYGDPLQRSYESALPPARWRYDGLISGPRGGQGRRRWYLTWTNPDRGAPLPPGTGTTFTFFYSGAATLGLGVRHLIVTGDGDLDAASARIAKGPAHVPGPRLT